MYGGGGIFPDIPLADRTPTPRWLNRLDEQELPAAALADFRAFAAKQGVAVPIDGDAQLQDVLLRSVAYARWGYEAAYRVIAARDGAVRQAIAGFAKADALLGVR